ncbi:MAG: hypothetical protein ABEJ76_09305 [Halanaeroarchaeum sp.]
MAVVSALRRTPGALLRNPVLFVPVLVLTLIQVPQLAAQAVDPFLAAVVSLLMMGVFVFVVPFFQGGVIGMADEALDGRTSLGRFVDAGRSNYVSLFGAYVAVLAVNLVLGVITAVLFVGAGALVFANGGAGSPVAALGALAIVGLVVALAYLLFAFFVQFYGQAIVLEGVGAIDGLKRSASVVRHSLASVLGYTVLVGVVMGTAGVLFGIGSVLLAPDPRTSVGMATPSATAVAILAVVLFVVGTVFGAFFATYSVAFYRAITGREPTRPPGMEP